MTKGYWGRAVEGSPIEMRRAFLAEDFVPYVEKVLADHPALRSAMLAVAQYWADEADDAVHATVVFSTRATPQWPHRCTWDFEDEGAAVPADAEECTSCGEYGYLPFDDNGSAITAFQACCHENGSQESTTAEAYLPYAVARRAEGGGLEVELVGGPVRAWLDDPQEAPAATDRADDAQTLALFEQVARAPRDDGPRHVLADALQQRGDPLGEYIALALAGPRGPEGATIDARLRELEAIHGAAWLGALAPVAPPERALFDRGLVRSLAVHFADEAVAAQLEGARAWGTVEELRFLPQSHQRLSTAMRALRDVGPLDATGLEELFRLGAALRLERAHVVLADDAMVRRLAELELPTLACLVVGGTLGGLGTETRQGRNPFTGEEMEFPSATASMAALTPPVLDPLRRARFWAGLRELVIASANPAAVGAWLSLPAGARPPVITFTAPARGYEIGGFRLRIEGGAATVDMPSVGAEIGLAQVGAMLAALPPAIAVIDVAPTRWFAPTAADLAEAARASGRPVRCDNDCTAGVPA